MKSLIEKFLAVGVGGFAGASLRFVVGECIKAFVKHPSIASGGFPYWTLAVNILGCLFFGFFMGSKAETTPQDSPRALFLLAGVLGGFTTYSAFGYETYKLLDKGPPDFAQWNVVLHIFIGIGAVKLGLVLADMLVWKW